MSGLKAKLKHLSSETISDLEKIADIIIRTGKADIIILFGYYTLPESDSDTNHEYDILVITDHWETKEELSKELSGAFSDFKTPVQGVIETITMVNINLEQGQYYFTEIITEGIILFDNKEFELSKPKSIAKQKRIRTAKSDFEECFLKAKEQWNQYHQSFEKSDMRSAAWFLNQLVEMCYTAIELVFSKYRNEEHRILLQRDRIRAFDKRVNNSFPVENSGQKKLFGDLDFAYTGARYRNEEEFPISREALEYWSGQAEQLLRDTQDICKDKIRRLEELHSKN